MTLRSFAKRFVPVAWVVLGLYGTSVLAERTWRVGHRFAQNPNVAVGVVAFDPAPGSRVVFYRFEAAGKTWLGHDHVDRVQTNPRAGDPVAVFYLASDPAVNSLVQPSPEETARETTFYAVLGGFLVLLTGYVAYRLLS